MLLNLLKAIGFWSSYRNSLIKSHWRAVKAQNPALTDEEITELVRQDERAGRIEGTKLSHTGALGRTWNRMEGKPSEKAQHMLSWVLFIPMVIIAFGTYSHSYQGVIGTLVVLIFTIWFWRKVVRTICSIFFKE